MTEADTAVAVLPEAVQAEVGSFSLELEFNLIHRFVCDS